MYGIKPIPIQRNDSRKSRPYALSWKSNTKKRRARRVFLFFFHPFFFSCFIPFVPGRRLCQPKRTQKNIEIGPKTPQTQSTPQYLFAQVPKKGAKKKKLWS